MLHTEVGKYKVKKGFDAYAQERYTHKPKLHEGDVVEIIEHLTHNALVQKSNGLVVIVPIRFLEDARDDT